MRAALALHSLFALVGAAVLGAAGTALPALAIEEHFETQPSTAHSDLTTRNGGSIRDDVFANWINGMVFTDTSQANVRNAIFLFEECYSGGMLDDLISVFNTTPAIPWIGGSACKHNEDSFGQNLCSSCTDPGTMYYDAPYPGDFWTLPMIPWWAPMELAPLMQYHCDQKMVNTVDQARSNDPEGVSHKNKETGQTVWRNSAENVTLKDPDAGSHHAILWAGKADGMRHYYDILHVRDALISCWGQTGPNVTITVLYGDGQHKVIGGTENLPSEWQAQEATSGNLESAIKNLAPNLGPNAQFLFYATDHGGHLLAVVLDEPVLPGQCVIRPYQPPFGVYQGMYLDPANQPGIRVSYSGAVLPGAVSVWFNGTMVGYLDPGVTEKWLTVAEETIQYPSNEVRVCSSNPWTILLNSVEFDTGAIGPPYSLTPASARRWPNGTHVGPMGCIVTAVFDDCFYIEEETRASGIRVNQPGSGLSRGDAVHVLGVIGQTEDAEPCINAHVVVPIGGGQIRPLGMTNASLGTTNVGLLVRTWGRFGYVDPVTFTVQDGSGASVMCVVGWEVYVDPGWTYVGVTGISSQDVADGEAHPLLLVRDQDDITPF